MNNLRIELWTHDEDSVWWPKVIIEPDGSKYLPEWDEKKIDLEFMQKYIGQYVDIYLQVGMQPKKLSVEKLVTVRKVDGIWEFATE